MRDHQRIRISRYNGPSEPLALSLLSTRLDGPEGPSYVRLPSLYAILARQRSTGLPNLIRDFDERTGYGRCLDERRDKRFGSKTGTYDRNRILGNLMVVVHDGVDE